MVQMSKIKIRKEFKQLRDNLSAESVISLSTAINENLIKQDEYIQATKIGCYYPINNEVIIKIKDDKEYYYPKIKGEELGFFKHSKNFRTNQYGIKEPLDSKSLPLNEIDIFLIPLIAFNDELFRVGYGGGFYDKTFSCFREKDDRPLLIGLSYDFLKTNEHFQSLHDVRLNKVVTDKGVYV